VLYRMNVIFKGYGSVKYIEFKKGHRLKDSHGLF
jgi:hypothetical protein